MDDLQEIVFGMASLKENEIDPQTGKFVRRLIITSAKANVYLDSELNIEYVVQSNIKVNGDDEILNRAASLEAESSFIPDESILMSIRFLIGKSYSMLYTEGSVLQANKLLDLAEQKLTEQKRNYSRFWYFTTSIIAVGVCAFLLLLVWLYRTQLAVLIGENAVHVLLGAFVGGFGALLSVYTRAGQLEFDATAGKELHSLEAILRVVMGLGGGVLASLAIKSGIIFNMSGLAHLNMPLLLLVSLVAGTSERLVPNITKLVEAQSGK
ncbi:hypothetical protein RAL05_004437 [Vibrio vulnificus]|nr:hypothetical protein [Vibrio vulnificus]